MLNLSEQPGRSAAVTGAGGGLGRDLALPALMQDRKTSRSTKPLATHGRTIHLGHTRTDIGR